MLIVMKFGGSSLANEKMVENAANIIINKSLGDNKIVAVVSAQGKTTDKLQAESLAINSIPSQRENDVLLSSGEQISMSLIAMKICSMGYDAISLTGWQAGIHTNDSHGNSTINYIDTHRLLKELNSGKIVIVAGFQGVDDEQDITTLGRGGSDTTAIALSAALNADECLIYTDVDGVYSANPQVVVNALKHQEISYEEMLEMSTLGAKVLHNRCVLMAKQNKVKFRVLSSLKSLSGTYVHDLTHNNAVTGVACDDNVSMINIIGIESGDAICKLFSVLAEKNIQVDVIIHSALSFVGVGVVRFSVSNNISETVAKLIEKNKDYIGFDKLIVEDNMAKISVIGLGMSDSCNIVSKMINALNKINIEAKYITTGQIKISAIILKTNAPEAQKAIHKTFFE
ncbi:MAG: aspartate kinase [Oscillospiraceae bacterium]